MQLSVSHQPRRSIIRPWMMSSLPTLVIIFAVLILVLRGGATIASGAVIVAQLDSGTPPPTAPPAPSSSSQENATASRFQIVVKDYTEDDNRLAGASSLAINSNSTSNETELSNSTVPLATPNSSTMTTKSPSNHARRSLKSGGMVSQSSSTLANRNNTQLLSVLAARRSLLHNNRSYAAAVPHQQQQQYRGGAHNYVSQQTMCERNCTRNFTIRGSAQCMRRCVVPSPARRRGEPSLVVIPATSLPEDSARINPSLDNDNNLSESNSIGSSADELLVTNESTAAHLIYREVFEATNNSKGGGGGVDEVVAGGGVGNFLERSRTKKNGTITKDVYSPTKNGPSYYSVERGTKRPRVKTNKYEGESLEFGQKIGSLGKDLVMVTEKTKVTLTSPRSVTMPRNLVASHRRGMLNFKSSLLSNQAPISAIPTRSEPFDVPSIDEIFTRRVVFEDARTEETRAAVAAIVTMQPEVSQTPVRKKNHGILLDLPPSTIQLDIRGSGGFEKLPENEQEKSPPSAYEVTETTENAIQESVEERTSPSVSAVVSSSESQEEALTKNIVVTTEKQSTTFVNLIVTTVPSFVEEESRQKDVTTIQPVATEDSVIVKPSLEIIPSISALFPNISAAAPSLLSSKEREAHSQGNKFIPLQYNATAEIEKQGQEEATSTTSEITIISSSTSTTEAPLPAIQEESSKAPSTFPPTTTSTSTTTQRSTTERIPYKPSPSRGYKPSTQKPSTTLRPVIPKRVEFTPSTIDSVDFRRTTLNPLKRFPPRTKKTTTTTISTSTSPETSTTTTSSSTTTTIKSVPANPPNTSFESIFNLSSIFPKFSKVPKVTTESQPSAGESSTLPPLLVIPSRIIPEPDSVLLQPNTDVTIELQRMNMATYVLAGLGMFPIVIIILYVIKTIIYNKQLKNNPQAVPVDSFVDQKISPVVMKTDGSSADHGEDILKEVELNRKNLRFKSILGEGNFGQVWKAEADDLPGHMGTTRIVAVKTERPEHGTGGLKQEAEIMFKLGSHPNVVTLLGCCVQEEPHLLIMEFAMRGRLLSLLRAARNAIHSMGGHVGTTRSSAIPLSPRRLSGFAHDIARGMEYITSKNIVHRDLAARNILLDHNGVCKICDFGMSIDLNKHKPTTTTHITRTMGRGLGGSGLMHHNSFENNMMWESETSVHKTNTCPEQRRMDICRSDSGVGGTKPSSTRPALPIRWMAPEALLHHIFSIETDVWAFGIVLWEIATLGCTPYPQLSGREVVRSVPSGVRPEIPPNCRPELYKLMAKTWHKDPRQRPTFTEARNELAHALRQWEMEQENTSEYLDVSGFSEDLEHGMVYFNRRISEFECEI